MTAGDVSASGRRAPFVAFEGIEGCGKSTQIERLAAYLRDRGRACLVTREPGGTALGDALRELLLKVTGGGIDGLTELFLLEAARRIHVREVIEPALSAGTTVICDRYADSSVAYQGGGRQLGRQRVEELNHLATGGLMPDLTFLLDLPPEAGLARVVDRGRPEDRLEREEVAFHARVREAYLELAGLRGPAYCVLEADRPADQIFAEVLRRLEGLLSANPAHRSPPPA